jgi:hypothetical protein
LGNGVVIINVTHSTFPLTAEFNAYHILPCGELTSQLQLQGYTSPFYDILRAGPDPEALIRLQFPPFRTTDSLLTDYSRNYSCLGQHSPSCKDKQCNPLRLVIENTWSMTKEPSIFSKYGLGVDVLGTDPLGAFELHLAPKPSQGTPNSTSTPTLPPHLNS